jgi:hypothetical protein
MIKMMKMRKMKIKMMKMKMNKINLMMKIMIKRKAMSKGKHIVKGYSQVECLDLTLCSRR